MSFTEQASIVINRSVKAVWEYVLEHDEWRRPYILEVNKLTEGEVNTGTRYENKVELAGNKMSIINEVTKVDPPNYLSWTQSSEEGPMTTIEGRYILKSEGQKTHFTLSADYELKGFAKLLKPIMSWQTRKKIYPKILNQLKEKLEQKQ